MTSIGVYCLDVGQGDCSFIVPPSAESAPILFDCADAYVASRFVKDHGISRLAAVVASHLDLDHIRGLLPFMRSFMEDGGSIDSLWIGIDRRLPGDSQAIAALLKQALEWNRSGDIAILAPLREAQPKVIAQGHEWIVSAVLPLYAEILGMRLDGGEEPNACSTVIRVECGHNAVLLGGDASLSSWARAEKALLPAVVFRTSHHGGDLGSCPGYSLEQLFAEAGATTAAFSVGTTNRYGHPLPNHVTAARRLGACRIVCTQVTAQCDSDPTDHVDAARRVASSITYPYRLSRMAGREVPCAGTVLVTLSGDGTYTVEPAASTHDALVDAFGSPLCRAP